MKYPPIVAIQGGLGNQLFQWFYAHEILAGRNFSLYAKYPEGPSVNVIRKFGLAPMIERCNHWGKFYEETVHLSKQNLLPKIFDRLWRIPFFFHLLQTIGFFQGDAKINIRVNWARLNHAFYVNGYFQKWNYAQNQHQWVHAELLPVLRTLYLKLSKEFDLSQPYTAIHVRRGDYRLDQVSDTRIGCLDDEYFIQWAREHPSSRIILLAEDKTEIENLVSSIKPALVLDNNSTTPWETLAIMSAASMFLGSNSSLSWWGAWTASINGASTFLPSKWDVMGRFNSSDFLFPECEPFAPVWESNVTSI